MIYNIGMVRKISLVVIVILSGLILGGCSLQSNATLQVFSTPRATVMLNNKIVGETPFFNTKVKAGSYDLKLIPIGQVDNILPYETKLELKKNTKTAVKWQFNKNEASASGYIMTQEAISDKKASVFMIVSNPSGATVKLDDQVVGTTPFQKDGLSPKQYKLSVSANGYQTEEALISADAGYKVIINLKLGQQAGQPEVSNEASASASPTPSQPPKKTITIKDTPTGWLRVRSEPGLSGKELGKVNPGDKFTVLDEKNGWYKIEYTKDKEGWVSGTYVKLNQPQNQDEKTQTTPTKNPKATPTKEATDSGTTKTE